MGHDFCLESGFYSLSENPKKTSRKIIQNLFVRFVGFDAEMKKRGAEAPREIAVYWLSSMMP